jgi:hypothetical protein
MAPPKGCRRMYEAGPSIGAGPRRHTRHHHPKRKTEVSGPSSSPDAATNLRLHCAARTAYWDQRAVHHRQLVMNSNRNIATTRYIPHFPAIIHTREAGSFPRRSRSPRPPRLWQAPREWASAVLHSRQDQPFLGAAGFGLCPREQLVRKGERRCSRKTLWPRE